MTIAPGQNWLMKCKMAKPEIGEIHIETLEGLGASYRMTGYFMLNSEADVLKVSFNGVAFGGHYGGHNVSIEISLEFKERLMEMPNIKSQESLDALLSEVQRRILTGDMTVDFETIKNEEEQQNIDPFGNISS
jgi:hypothetical protein